MAADNYRFTSDYYIDILSKIQQVWIQKERPDGDNSKWGRRIIKVWAHLDTITTAKSMNISLQPSYERKIIEFLLLDIGHVKLGRIQVAATNLFFHQEKLKNKHTLQLLTPIRKEAFWVEWSKTSTADKNAFVDDMLRRMQHLCKSGIDQGPLYEIAKVYRRFYYKYFIRSDIVDDLYNDLMRLLPALMGFTAFSYVPNSQLKLILQYIYEHLFAHTGYTGDKLYFTEKYKYILTQLEDDENYTSTINTALINHVCQGFSMYLDHQNYIHNDKLRRKVGLWMNPSSIFEWSQRSLSNSLDSVNESIDEYTENAFRLFEKIMSEKIKNDNFLESLEKALNVTCNLRSADAEYQKHDTILQGLLFAMWQMIHLSGAPIVYGTLDESVEYIHEAIITANDIKTRIQDRGLSLAFGFNIEGDYDAQIKALKKAYKILSSGDVTFKERCKIAEGIRGRMRAVLGKDLELHLLSWYGPSWRDAYDKLKKYADIANDASSPEVYKTEWESWLTIASKSLSSPENISIPTNQKINGDRYGKLYFNLVKEIHLHK